MSTTRDWKDLAITSHYLTAVGVEQALEEGDYGDAKVGIEELIEALSRVDKRALRSQLVRLMMHIVKWRTQPDKRTRSWKTTIRHARREIREIQEQTPSLNRAVIELMWDKAFKDAIEDAEEEMDQKSRVTKLSWKEVFEKEYELE